MPRSRQSCAGLHGTFRTLAHASESYDPPVRHSMAVRILDRSLSRLPTPLRTLIDWALTIALIAVAVLIFQAEVAKPYRIPTSSMEPTLHCAKPADGCKSRVSDRVIANRLVYRFHQPERGDIIVFRAPPQVEAACGAGGTFIKRIVGLPGETLSMRGGHLFINGAPLAEPYLRPAYRGTESGSWDAVPHNGVLRPGRQPRDVVRLASLGRRSPRQHHRPRGSDLLAPNADQDALGAMTGVYVPAFRGHS